MEAYSALLLIALVATTLTAGRAILGHRGAAERWLSAGATLAASGSLVLHVSVDHSPGSPEGFAPLAFVIVHPTLLATRVTALALVLWLWLGRRRDE